MPFNIEDHPGILLKKIARLFEQVSNVYLKPLGITHAQTVILVRLWENEGLSQAALVKSAALDQSTVVRLLDRMERDGLIIRKQSQIDRRMFHFYLTQKSKKICQKMQKYSEKMTVIAHQSVSEKEFDMLKKILAKINANLEAFLTEHKS